MPDDAIRPPDDPYDPTDLGRRPFRPPEDERVERDEPVGRRPFRPEWDERAPPPVGGWGTFSNGARCVWAALLIFLIVAVVVRGLAFAGGAGGGRESFAPLNALAGLGGLGAFVTWFVGICLLCAVPAQTGLRPLAFAALAAVIVCLLLFCVFMMLLASAFGATFSGRGGPDETGVLAVLALLGLVALGGYVCHCLLLSGAARQLGDPGLAGGFIALLIVSVVGVVALVVLTMALLGAAFDAAVGGRPSAYSAYGDLQGLALGLNCLTLVFELGMMIWALVLLGRLIERCARPARGRAFDDDF
jgi:hypothetical protein